MNIKLQKRKRRHSKIRSKVSGTANKPRLSIFKSNKHLYAQLINDNDGKTIASSSDLAITGASKKKMKEIAVLIGADIAKKAKENKIDTVVFDRGGFNYNGNIEILAQGARDGGLNF